MNDSIIRTRYADALVKYVRETGNGESVCLQAERLARVLGEVPDLSRMVAAKDVVSDAKKRLNRVMNGSLSILVFIFCTFSLLREKSLRAAAVSCLAVLSVAVPPMSDAQTSGTAIASARAIVIIICAARLSMAGD